MVSSWRWLTVRPKYLGASSIDPEFAALVARIREAFPELKFSSADLEDRGGDHRVIVLDKEYAFRFPRGPDSNLELEIAVLDVLQPRCQIPTPHYQWIAPDLSFAGYRFIQGIELTAGLFTSLPSTVRELVLDQAAALMSAVHSLDPGQIADAASWRHVWTAQQFAQRTRERLAVVEPAFPQLAKEISDFCCIYEYDSAPVLVVLHGDLIEDHFLLSAAHDRLSGVIDFGDVGLGDAADDLKGIWAYGEDAVKYVISRYDLGRGDLGLMPRSRRAYLRYRIDRLTERLRDEGMDPEAVAEASDLQRILSKSRN